MLKLATAVHNSTNSKLGDCAATYAAQQSCPRSCPFYGNGCYAEQGFVAFTTNRLNKAGREAKAGHIRVARAEARAIDGLPGSKLLRLHVVGDAKSVEAVRILRKAVDRYVERSESILRRSPKPEA